jgi:hypothetical protein
MAASPGYVVGDRVILQGLNKAAHLNGRHGCIATPLNEQGRFGIDVDVDPTGRRAVKPGNLLPEEPSLVDPRLDADGRNTNGNTNSPRSEQGGTFEWSSRCIATPLNEQGRFGIDVDVDPTGHRAVKPGNLPSEEPLLVDHHLDANGNGNGNGNADQQEVVAAQAVNGILEESHGKAASYLLELMRVNASYHFASAVGPEELERMRKSPTGLLRIAHLTALGWTHWMGEEGGGREDGVHGLMVASNKEMIEENHADLPPELYLARDALQTRRAAGGWDVRVNGNFWIVSQHPETGGALMVAENNFGNVYDVLGIRNALYPMVAADNANQNQDPSLPFTPVLLTATLIPWYGRLIYDGVVGPAHNRRVPKQANALRTQKLMDAVQAAKVQGRIIQRLRETQANTTFAPAPPVATATASTGLAHHPPPTRDEAKLLHKLAALPAPLPIPHPEDGDTTFGAATPFIWVFRRMGYTQEENPHHGGVVMVADGSILGPFQCSTGLAPTSIDILKSMVFYGSRQTTRRQASCINIDDHDCFERVRFLLKDTDIRVEYYKPPSKEETAACTALGEAGQLGPRMV